MRKALIQNKSRPLEPPILVQILSDYWSRLRGLMFYPGLPPNQGVLLIEPVEGRIQTAIHMLFMRFEIAVVWINTSRHVVDVRLARPWQIVHIPARPALMVLETHPQHINSFQINDEVEIHFL